MACVLGCVLGCDPDELDCELGCESDERTVGFELDERAPEFDRGGFVPVLDCEFNCDEELGFEILVDGDMTFDEGRTLKSVS